MINRIFQFYSNRRGLVWPKVELTSDKLRKFDLIAGILTRPSRPSEMCGFSLVVSALYKYAHNELTRILHRHQNPVLAFFLHRLLAFPILLNCRIKKVTNSFFVPRLISFYLLLLYL